MPDKFRKNKSIPISLEPFGAIIWQQLLEKDKGNITDLSDHQYNMPLSRTQYI